jgi:pimeloyl-ACP methyl ester carboxylesterase
MSRAAGLGWPRVPSPLALLALALLLALAAWAHLAFWARRLAVPSREDQRLEARTHDGWTLALFRRRPRAAARATPVLLLHGIAMNRRAMDLDLPGRSLAASLAGAGFDCFALDLRGHGASRAGAPRGWTLDHYLGEDLPAALDAVRAATGAPRAFLVGHSQGALLALATAALRPERVAGVVALAPAIRPGPTSRQLRLLALLARLRLTRLLLRLVAPLAGGWQPRLADLAVHRGALEPFAYRRMLMNAMEDLPPGVVAQFRALAAGGGLGADARLADLPAALARAGAPALFVAAPEDGLAPPAVVEAGARAWGGEVTLERAPAGVGHTDLLLGARGAAWLHPLVSAWLVAHDDVGVAGNAAPPRRPEP